MVLDQMKSEESGSTLRTAIQPPHLDFRRRSPSQGESAPVIGLLQPCRFRGGGLGPRNHQPRAGREYRIDRPPCLTNPRPQGFSLPTVFQPHIHAEPRHTITPSSLPTAVQSFICQVASPADSPCCRPNCADQTRPETPSSCHPVNHTTACSLPGMGLQGRGSREKYWRVISFAFSALQK